MVTIHDVAARAGVSIATVSNVINKTRKVAPATEAKVNAALKELNYVPNIMAKSLKTSNYNSIGIIAEELISFSTAPMIDAICGYFDSQGYTVNLCNLRTYSHSEYDTKLLNSSLNTLKASRVSGIIYIGATRSNISHISPLISLPTIFAYAIAGPEDYVVTYDEFQAAKTAAKYLIQHGHKRIGIITGALNTDFVHQRIMGFRSAMVEEKIPLPPEYIQAADWSFELAYEQTCKLLSLEQPPTAIFAMNDHMACAAVAAAYKLGLKVPNDLSIIGFDNRDCSAYNSPSITTLRIPHFEIGNIAAKSLMDLLAGNELPKLQMLSCSLIERESVAYAPQIE